jgi:hypothetical protein
VVLLNSTISVVMRLVETILGMGSEDIKENNGGGGCN